MQLEEYLRENVDFSPEQLTLGEMMNLFNKSFEEKVLLEYDDIGLASRNSASMRKPFYKFTARTGVDDFYRRNQYFDVKTTTEFITPHLAGARNILDLGCFDGLNTVWYALQNPKARVTSIDFVEEFVDKCRKLAHEYRVNNLSLILGDITKMPFPDNYFDLVIAGKVLHELQEGERGLLNSFYHLVPEVARVTKSGGRIVGTLVQGDREDASCISSYLSNYFEDSCVTGFESDFVEDPKEKDSLLLFKAVKN